MKYECKVNVEAKLQDALQTHFDEFKRSLVQSGIMSQAKIQKMKSYESYNQLNQSYHAIKPDITRDNFYREAG